MMNPLPVMIAEFRRSRAGCIAVVLLIALAVALGVAVSAQERALRQGSARAADAFDLLVGAPGSQTQLVLTTVYLQPAAVPLLSGLILQKLAAEPGVEFAAPIGFGDRWKSYAIVGSTATFVTNAGRRAPVEGRVFTAMYEAVIGADVTAALGQHITPSHGQPGTARALDDSDDGHDEHKGIEYTVVGRLPPQGTPWDRAIIVPIEAVWDVHGMSTGHSIGDPRIGPPWESEPAGVPAIVVKPKTVMDAYRLRALYRGEGTLAVFPAEILVELYRTLGDARDLLAAISIATEVLVVAAVLLAVSALLALRARQLAILRALGASRSYVFLVVWGYVGTLIVAGGAAGLMLGYGGAVAMAGVLEARTGLHLTVELGLPELSMVAGLIAAGLLLALLPAIGSYRRPVVDALKG
jgi:putative ABC transport system permease protein